MVLHTSLLSVSEKDDPGTLSEASVASHTRVEMLLKVTCSQMIS